MNVGDQRLPLRFWDKVDVVESGCWEWVGARGGMPDGTPGYGHLSVGGTLKRAHRVSYEALVGPIPSGFVIDHLCRNKPCVNPEHLEAVTQSENTLRGAGPGVQRERNRAITHCPRSHPYNERNTYVWRGSRYCRACNRDQARLRRQRSRAGTL